MEETIINDTFLDTTPQELISYFLAQAGLSKMKLSSKTYPTRKMLPIRRQTAVQAINAVNAAWGLRVPFFFSGGVFYWDEKPEQKKVYTFERGVNILNLRRAGGVWELETVSAPLHLFLTPKGGNRRARRNGRVRYEEDAGAGLPAFEAPRRRIRHHRLGGKERRL